MADTVLETQIRLVLERQCRELAVMLKKAAPAGTGFCFFLFDYGVDGNIAYCSTADRDDTRSLILEWLEKNPATPPRSPQSQAALDDAQDAGPQGEAESEDKPS